MNILDQQKPDQKILDQQQREEQMLLSATKRSFIVAAIVAAAGLVLHEADTGKGNKIEVFALDKKYSNHKANFDELLVYATQNHTAPWIDRGGGRKELNIPTGKGGEKYILSVIGDQIVLSFSSYDHEYIWKYIERTGSLEVKGNINLDDAVMHFGEVQKLISQQYPNF